MSREKKSRVLLDVPLEDQKKASFGFVRYSQVLTDLILNSEPHFTLGIFGSWGSGKTTLMQLIYRELMSEFDHGEAVVPVWFNVWRYERETNLIVPLLHTISDELNIHIDRRSAIDHGERTAQALSTLKRLAIKLGDIAKVVAAGAKFSVSVPGEVFKVEYDSGKGSDEFKKSQKDNDTGLVYYDTFRDLAGFMQKQETGTRVVVFIDDLDRCFTEKAIEMLEATKLFLDMSGFIFVMGVDEQVITTAVQSKYGQDAGIRGVDYLKKIVQVPFRLPPLRQRDVEEYVRGIELEQLGSLPVIPLRRIVQVVAAGIQANPRDIKRFLNNFVLTKRISGDDTDPEKLISLLVIQFRWPEVYHQIARKVTAFERLAKSLQALYESSPDILAQISLNQLRDKVVENLSELKQARQDLLNFEETGFIIPDDAWTFLLSESGRPILTIEGLETYIFFADATEFVPPNALHFANNAYWAGEYENEHPRYEWCIWVDEREQVLRQISQVIYHLPSGKVVAELVENRFQCTSFGYRELSIDIDVIYRNGSRTRAFHKLELLKFGVQRPDTGYEHQEGQL